MCPQQPNATQGSSGTVEEKRMCTKEKGKVIATDASSNHVIADDNNKISKKEVVMVSSNKEKTLRKVYTCSYCQKEFSCQQAMAGHSNLHRSEWASPKRKPEYGEIQSHKHTSHSTTSYYRDPIMALLQKSYARSSSAPGYASSTSHKPLLRAAEYPLANPLNIVEVQWARAPLGPLPRYSLVNPLNILEAPPAHVPLGPSPGHSLASLMNNFEESSPKFHLAHFTNTFNGPSQPARAKLSAYPTNTLIWPSLGAPQRTFFGQKNTLHISSIPDLNHPSDNREKPHGKSRLGVRYEYSLIQKPSHRGYLGQADKLVKIWPPELGGEQIGDNMMMGLGTNNGDYNLRSLLTAAGTESSSTRVCGGSHKASESVSSSFQPRGGEGINGYALFPITPSKKKHNHGVDDSSQG